MFVSFLLSIIRLLSENLSNSLDFFSRENFLLIDFKVIEILVNSKWQILYLTNTSVNKLKIDEI